MIELPEAIVLSEQINENLRGKRILNVIAEQSPHKFAWYHGDPQGYHELLSGKQINKAVATGGMVEIQAEDCTILFSEGVNLRFHAEHEKRPQKHQLLIEFDDFTAFSASVQMYGGLCCFQNGIYDNPYYKQAREKPSPMTTDFDERYFQGILSAPGIEKLSAKALLATEQRVPGLGNGVLQDILYNARIHPKRKVLSLSSDERKAMYNSVKNTLAEMAVLGGRDTENDLFGCPGGYKTKLSRNTAGKPCLVCGGTIVKDAYLGGSIYYCSGCQRND